MDVPARIGLHPASSGKLGGRRRWKHTDTHTRVQ